MKFRDANVQVNKKNSFTHPLSCISPSFYQNASRLLLSKSFKVCENNLFPRKVVLLVIYLFHHHSSKSTFSKLNMAFDAPLSRVLFLSNKIGILRTLNTRTSFYFALSFEAKEKKLLLSVWAPSWDFFSDCVHFFWNNKWIEKILNRKRKLKIRKENEISWKRKMLGHSFSLTLFIYIYKSEIYMFRLM